jgi:hypothetical protein
MSDQALVTMLLCADVEPAEQAKVERLDGPIAEKFRRAGFAVRICQGEVEGEQRVLRFYGPRGVVASVSADDFLAASDKDAVARIAFEG